MKRLFAGCLSALFVCFALLGCAGMSGSSGWTALVDGERGLENFDRLGDANWRAEGGAIVADKGKGASYLVTKNSYKDFQIRAEFWAETTTNSGIFIRAADRSYVAATNSYEVNVYDLRPDPLYGTGAIVDFAKVAQPMPKAGGRWNTFLITAMGDEVTVVFNGVETVKLRNSKFASGPFALQFANGPNNAPGGTIKWRKLELRAL